MKTAAAIAYFKNKRQLALALGITPNSVQEWGLTVPPLRQFQLEAMTNGDLQVDPRLKPSREPIRGEAE